MSAQLRRPILSMLHEIPGVLEPIQNHFGDRLAKINIVNPRTAQGNEPELQEADIIITEPHYAKLFINGFPQLKVVLGTWAGVDSLIKVKEEEQVSKPTFQYCRFAGSFGPPIAEYVIAYIVAQERNLRLTYNEQARCNWSQDVKHDIWYKSRFLHRMSIGILGVGDIGRCVAKVCKAFDMKVWGVVKDVPTDPEKRCQHIDEYRGVKDLDEVLSSCEYICNILPSTSTTRGLLDNNRLEHCKQKKAVFMNVGRGDICTESSILTALEKGWIRAAILDVFNPEPLDKDSALWSHPDVTITPHVAAVSLPHLISDLLIENIENVIHDRPLKYAIDWDKGY